MSNPESVIDTIEGLSDANHVVVNPDVRNMLKECYDDRVTVAEDGGVFVDGQRILWDGDQSKNKVKVVRYVTIP